MVNGIMNKKLLFLFSALLTVLITGCTTDTQEFTVDFNSMGGTTIEEVIVTDGSLTEPNPPTKEGYDFVGWYLDESYSVSMDFTNQISENMTLYAKWDILQFTITTTDYDERIIENITLDYGADLTAIGLLEPTREGYTFDGWDMELPDEMPLENIALTAQYTINSYFIKYVDSDGTVLQETAYDYGADLTNVEELTHSREGYTFYGWDIPLPDTMPAEDIILTAQFAINGYFVRYIEPDGTLIQEIVYEYGADLTGVELLVHSMDGYTFDGWDNALPDSMPAEDIVLTAQYTINSYSLIFLDYDGSVIVESLIEFGADLSLLEEPLPNRRGYHFDGWDINLPAFMPSHDVFLTAMYSIESYSLIFIDYDCSIIQETLFEYGEDLSAVIIEDPVREGLIFHEWSRSIPANMPDYDFRIYARYHLDMSIKSELTTEITDSVLLPFDNESLRYTLDETAELEIFYEEDSVLPYVDIEGFLQFLDGSIDYDLFTFSYGPDTLTIDYTQNNFVFDGFLANGTFQATFDFTENTVTVNSFDFFRGYQVYSSLDPFEHIIYQSHESSTVSETTIPLGDYNIDLTIYNDGVDDNYLIPFHIANLLFLHSHRFNLYYNGVKITGYDDAYVAWDENELDPALYEMNMGPLNDENLPVELRVASFHYLALAFDYFHGVSNEYDNSSFYDKIVLDQPNPARTEDDYGEAIWRTLINVDDPGTWYSRVGYYDDRPLFYYDPSYEDSLERIQELFMEYYNANVIIDEGLGTSLRYQNIHVEDIDDYLPEVRLIAADTIAIIYLVDFFDATPDNIKVILDDLPPTVTSVVFDTSVSFFGKPQIAIEILGFMTNQPIEYTVKDTFDGKISTYTVSVNQPYYEYDYYIISSKFTYGMANIFIQLAKDNNLATHLGLKTIGGSSPLTSGSTSDGTNFIMTSPMMFIRRLGNESDGYTYWKFEHGISPDIVVEHYTTEQDITNAINGGSTNSNMPHFYHVYNDATLLDQSTFDAFVRNLYPIYFMDYLVDKYINTLL